MHGKHTQLLATAIVLGVMAPVAFGNDAANRNWSHKDWRSVSYTDDAGKLHCTTLTGGDGDNTFRVDVDSGGNFLLEYEEQVVRGYPTKLGADDNLYLAVEGPASMAYDDITVFDEQDDYGDRVLRATLPSGHAAEFTGMLRKGTHLALFRRNDDSHDPGTRSSELIQRFSLAGFTANLVKIGEWCAFDPNDIFTP
jgi:hypothetical protein